MDKRQQIADSAAIIERFFGVLATLIDNGVIRGTQTFTRRYDINRRNFITMRKNPSECVKWFELAWLYYLARDFKVNANYIITGNGSMFYDGWNADTLRAYFRAQKAAEKRRRAEQKAAERAKKEQEQLRFDLMY